MAKIDAALDLCIELGKLLAQTSEYQNMKQAEANLLHNEEAQKLMEEMQSLQMQIQRKKLAGLDLTEEDKKLMQETEQNALKNPIIKDSFEAHEKFQAIMNLASTKIREGIRSMDE